MLSYTAQRNMFAQLVNNAGDTATLALADTLLNQRRRLVLTRRPWWFMEKQFTQLTTTSQFQNLPGQVDRLISSPTVTIGSQRYTPDEAPSWDYWNRLNLTTFTADIPQWWIQYGRTFGLWPTPATAGNTITYNAKQRVIDLSKADYTTGTITTVAAGGTTITGSGTSWTAGMAGSWIKITGGNAANLGDDTWYEITAATSTSITIAGVYGGTAIAAGTANYTIGQMHILPEAYDELPLYMALTVYFTSIDPNTDKKNTYASLASEAYTTLVQDHSNRTGGRVLDWGIDEVQDIINPNLTIRG